MLRSVILAAILSLVVQQVAVADTVGVLDLRPQPVSKAFGTAIHVTTIWPAEPFDSFPECKPKGPAILSPKGEVQLCESETGTSRQAVHAKLVALISAMFAESFPKGPRQSFRQ